MRRITLTTAVILTLSLMACTNQNKPNSEIQQVGSNQKSTTDDMKSFISLFEIPATDISRAINFYQLLLDINIEKIEMPAMEMGIFPYEQQMVPGVIVKGEGYNPSPDGVTIYLNGGDNLQNILERVEKLGGTVIVPKTAHADGSGFFALFLDTEGNKLGLNSPN